MVDFISCEQAKELAHAEPVAFVEIMGEAPGARSLEVHIMSPSGVHLHEIERAEDRWPPPWA